MSQISRETIEAIRFLSRLGVPKANIARLLKVAVETASMVAHSPDNLRRNEPRVSDIALIDAINLSNTTGIASDRTKRRMVAVAVCDIIESAEPIEDVLARYRVVARHVMQNIRPILHLVLPKAREELTQPHRQNPIHSS